MKRPIHVFGGLFSGKRAALSAGVLGLVTMIPLATARAAGPADALVGSATTAFKAGHLDVAADLFAQARRADPNSLLAVRGACEVALEREAQDSKSTISREPCRAAFRLGGLPEDDRNELASMMAPANKVSLEDLALGVLLVESAQHQGIDPNWAYLARCDIGRRLRSPDTFADGLDYLKRFAPHHPATAIALRLDVGRASTGVWLIRIFLLLGLAATAIHALYRTRRARNRKVVPVPAGALVLFALFGLVAGSRPGHAEEPKPAPREQLSSHFHVDDADPEAGVPTEDERNKQPLEYGYYLQDLAGKAQKAAKAGDHAAEARFYRALTMAAPDSAFGPRQLCRALEAASDQPNAVIACRTALTRNGSNASDYIHFVGLVLRTPGPLPPEERRELDAVISHLGQGANLGAVAPMLRCDVALRFNDRATLELCSNELGRIAPKDPKTLSFQWALAIQKNDRGAALDIIERAREAGMKADGLAVMEKQTRAMTMRHLGRILGAATIATLLGTLLVLALRRAAAVRRRLAV